MKSRGSPVRMGSAIALCVLFAAAASALDVALTYKARPAEQRGFFPYGHQMTTISLEPPEGNWKLPKQVNGKPVYALIDLGERKHLLVLDKENESDTSYSRLHFDANANGDLTDDQAHTGQLWGGTNHQGGHFQQIPATVLLQGKEFPYLLSAQFSAFMPEAKEDSEWEPDPQHFHVYISSDSAYHGSFSLDGGTYDVWLGDGNANGRFGDFFAPMADRKEGQIYGVTDYLFLADSHEQIGYSHAQMMGRHLVFGKKVFTAEVDIPGKVMRLTPVEEEFAALSFPAELASLQVYQPETNAVVTILPDGKQAPVPPGDYRLLHYRLSRRETDGAQWEVVGAGTMEGPVVKAPRGASGKVPLGEPFGPKVTVQYYGLKDNKPEAHLNFEIQGSGNEIVSDLRLVNGKSKVKLSSSDSNRPAEPTYRMVNAEGEVVASGRFEYG